MKVADEKRVLFISYAFPPTGGAGVQRSAKFVKFLSNYSWYPTVLTATNPSVPVQDHNLLRDIPPSISILRARTCEPGYATKRRLARNQTTGTKFRNLIRSAAMSLLQPDPQILWNAAAYRAASKQLRQVKHQAIFVTGPPFSSFLLGCQLKAKFGLPVVFDFRDEWALVSRHMENHRPGPWTQWRQTRMRSRALASADAIIATTQLSARELEKECAQVNPSATASCIYNGFDVDDLVHLNHAQSSRAQGPNLRLVYTGTLWNLTDIGPLVSALRRVSSSSACDAIELHIAGRRTEAQDLILGQLTESNCIVTLHDYLPHQESLMLAASADMLLLTLADEPGAERVVPAKVFEYMALQKEILAIVPGGEVREILAGYPPAKIFHPNDREGIAQWLTERLARKSTDARPKPDAEYVRQYSRSAQAEQLAYVLDTVACRR